MRRLTLRPALLLAPLALAVAACGSDDATGEPADPTPVGSDPATTGDDQPAATEPPPTDPPPPTEPAATEPAATEPAATEPAPTEPPATEPAAPTEPPPTEPAATEPAPAPFTPIGAGPYAVGVHTITITDPARNRPLTVDVWFPLEDGAGDGAPSHRYTFVTGDYYESPAAVTVDPSAVATDGPFPLVVYSHGSGGTRYIHSDYTEALASHGHVVAAPDHTGNTAVERVSGAEIDRDRVALDRPLDVRTVIDAMTDTGNPTTAPFVAAVDPERIAVTGHSFGGYTTYAVVSGYENALGASAPDERVDAIIPLAPAVGTGDPETSLLTDDRLAAVGVPALVMVGTDDITTPVDPNVTRAWDLTASSPHYRLELVAGEHQTFTDACAYLEFLPTLDPPATPLVVETIETLAVEGCSPDDMPIERAQELTNTFAIRFLDSIFDGGEMITPENTAIPEDVNYLVRD